MPLCKVDYDRSEVRDYQNEADAGHQYLSLTLVPKTMNSLMRSYMGSLAEYHLNFFPPRDRDTSEIDQEFEDELIADFNKKALHEVYVERVEVEIPPTLMTYTSGENKGEIITVGGVEKVYTTVQITCLMKEKADKSGMEPAIPMNRLKSQALRMREQRINSGLWFDATSEAPDEADTANIVTVEEETEAPKQQPTQQQQRPTRPTRPTRQ